jgi:drug/metabolite transporter (DMT)-like permease
MGLSGLILAAVTLVPANLMSIQLMDWVYLALLGLIVVPIPFSLLAIGPRYLPASEVSLLLLLEAVLGPLWVWLVLKEFPGWLALIGGAIVIVTLVAMNVYALRREMHHQGK